jgi:hypothetical protein
MVQEPSISVIPALLTGERSEAQEKNEVRVMIKNNTPSHIYIVNAGFILTANGGGRGELQNRQDKTLITNEETGVSFRIGDVIDLPFALEYQITFRIGRGPMREWEGEFRYDPCTREFSEFDATKVVMP